MSGASGVAAVRSSLAARAKRTRIVTCAVALVALMLVAFEMCLGNTFYSPSVVIDVLMGAQVKGASYAILSVRLPRTIAAIACGAAFGMGGNVFQIMLRNPLASPDVIGISSGASVVAVFSILILRTGAGPASAGALAGAVVVALAIYAFACIGGFSEGKLILVGIAAQAFMQALVSTLLLKGATDDVPAALRWLSGSLAGLSMADILPLAAIPILAAVIMASLGKLSILELGDESAIALGVPVGRSRALLLLCSVGMVAIATSVTGPIACVALLSGPIATRLVHEQGAATLASGFIGMSLIMAADLAGHFLLGTRFPAGVVTGLLGTPYLLWLLVRLNREGVV